MNLRQIMKVLKIPTRAIARNNRSTCLKWQIGPEVRCGFYEVAEFFSYTGKTISKIDSDFLALRNDLNQIPGFEDFKKKITAFFIVLAHLLLFSCH